MADQLAVPFYKMWQFWVPVVVAVVQIPASFVAVRALTTTGPVFSVTADLNNVERRLNEVIGPNDQSQVTLSIKNVGDRPAEEVTIRLQTSGDYEFTNDDAQKHGTFTNQIEIGKLKNGSTASCKIWTNRRLDPSKDSVLLTHSTGDYSVTLPRKSIIDPEVIQALIFIVVFAGIAAIAWTAQRSARQTARFKEREAAIRADERRTLREALLADANVEIAELQKQIASLEAEAEAHKAARISKSEPNA